MGISEVPLIMVILFLLGQNFRENYKPNQTEYEPIEVAI